MLGRLIDFVLDPERMIILLSGVAAFVAFYSFALPYFDTNPLGRRLQEVARRRQELRAIQLASGQKKSHLRRERPSMVRELVDRFKLRDLFANDELKAKLVQANWRNPNAVAFFVAGRLLLPLALGGLAVLLLYGSEKSQMKEMWKIAICVGSAGFGYYLPMLLMENAIQKRQAAFTKSFPDALDLLLICVESGLSIEAGFGRVAQEIGGQAAELAEEFELTTAELAYLPDRRIALENLALRTGLPPVKAVTTTLVQAEKYGTPLTQALRIAATENRDRRMAIAEKKAHSLPALLTGPMIIFFLPVLFLVILGPVFIRMGGSGGTP